MARGRWYGHCLPGRSIGLQIILCEDAPRRDKVRLFVELTREGLSEFRREISQRSVPNTVAWWGYDVIQVDDPDGNELLLPTEVSAVAELLSGHHITPEIRSRFTDAATPVTR